MSIDIKMWEAEFTKVNEKFEDERLSKEYFKIITFNL